MASLDDILTALKGGVNAVNGNTQSLQRQTPSSTSGQLAADTLVQAGFVRITGISVVVAGAVGGLYDAPTIALAGSGQQVFVVPASTDFIPLNMVFANGLVYKPGAAQVAAIFYTRV